MKNRNEFFKKVIELMGSNIRTTKEMYGIILDAKTQLGIQNKEPESKILNELCEVLGPCIEEIEDTETASRGRCKPKLFTLKGENEEIRNRIENYHESGLKPIPSIVLERTACMMATLGTRTKRKYERRFPGKALIDKVDFMLSTASNRQGHNYVSFRELYTKFNSDLSSSTINDWFKTLERFGVSFNYTIEELKLNGRPNKVIMFRNLEYDMNNFKTAKNKWLGLSNDSPEKTLKPAAATAVVRPAAIVETPQVKTTVSTVSSRNPMTMSSMTDDIIFIIAGLVCSASKAIDFEDICATLRKDFRIKVDRTELIKIIRQEPEFSTVMGKALGFKDGSNSWERIVRKYNPCNEVLNVYARISITLDQLQSYFPEAEVCSKISEEDAIYKIVMDKSQHSYSKLIRLYRTFRGTDMIIGNEELVCDMETQIKIADGLWNGNNKRYQIERLITK